MAGPVIDLFCFSQERPELFSTVIGPIGIPINSKHGFLFTTASPAPAVSCLLEDSCSGSCELMSRGDVGVHFPDE